ncbi:MAG: UDP-3-O-(3-hydroxymyristoyl)glucosamine N-acyltransferase [bacterium]
MLAIRKSTLSQNIENLLKVDGDFTILPVEGVNSIYFQNSSVFMDLIKISFVFSKRIFFEDLSNIEANDIFADYVIVDRNLSKWFRNLIKKNLNLGNFGSSKIIEVDNAFDLFLECLKQIKLERRDFGGENRFIDKSCIIHDNVHIGSNVYIGSGTVIYPNVVIYDNVYIGSNVVIHSNSVIGADGFGYTDNIQKIPQEGGVVIRDNVEIGACSCIDRATIGYTYIGQNTKIDNLVQIGHNVKIGKNCRIAGKSGVAGSARIYDNSIIAAMAGVRDGIKVGPNSILAGASMATKSIPPNQIYAGNPARPFNQYFKELSKSSKLQLNSLEGVE